MKDSVLEFDDFLNYKGIVYLIILCFFFFFWFVEQDLAGDVVQNLKEYFGAIYKKVVSNALHRCTLSLSIPICWHWMQIFQVTEADIEEFEANYRGSDSEKKDLVDLYKKYKGHMNR